MQMFDRFYVDSLTENAKITLDRQMLCDDVELVKLRVDYGESVVPEKISVRWEEDMTGVLYCGHPCCGSDYGMYQAWCASRSASRFGFGAPLLFTIGENSVNSCTVAVNDASTPLTIKFWVDDFPQKYKVKYEVIFFDGNCEPVNAYEAVIRIDKRKIPYYEALSSVYPWWKENGYVIPPVPEEAEDALYSSWYNFHQMPESAALLKDLAIARDLGFKTVKLIIQRFHFGCKAFFYRL